jgi:hypothetical protein
LTVARVKGRIADEIVYMCDICGERIDLAGPGMMPYTFEVIGLQGKKLYFHAHRNVCRAALKRAQNAKSWKLLPDGPLKEMYFETLRQRGQKT